MKKLFGTLVAVGAMALMAVGVQAATYSATAGATPGEDGYAVVDVLVTPGEDGTESVNGYVMTFTYDSSKVTPAVVGTDAIDEDCYATVGEEFTNGVLVAGDATTDESSTTKTLAVAWAGADAVTVSEETAMASVEFKVVDGATGTADIQVAVVALTNGGEKIADSSSYSVASGTITLDTEEILYGDINGDKAIDSYDASLALRHYSTSFLTDDEIEIGDVNDDGVVDSYDASLILQRYSDESVIFPVEQNK